MLQFARYEDGNSATEILLSIIQKNSITNSISITKFIDELNNWYVSLDSQFQGVYRLRMLAMLSRLLFWDGKSTEIDLIAQLGNFAGPYQDQVHLLPLEDSAYCVGVAVAEKLNIHSLHSSVFAQSPDTNRRFDAISSSSERYWVYRPRLSGFFSIIENIVCASLLAKAHDKKLLVDLDGNWWTYPIEYAELFGNFFPTLQGVNKYHRNFEIANLNFEHMRGMYALLCQADPAYVRRQKIIFYKFLREYLIRLSTIPSESVSRIRHESVLYIRAGDKLVFEAVQIPDEYYLRDIKELRRSFSGVTVLSDDFATAERICKRFGDSKVINGTEKIFNGYYDAAVNPALGRPDLKTYDDVRAIINNYVFISSAAASASCPSSNIVNSAHWSSESTVSLKLNNTPVYSYLML
jgi:hypothetical protein